MNEQIHIQNDEGESESVESESRVKHNIKVMGLRFLYTSSIKDLIYTNFVQNLNLIEYLNTSNTS